MTDQNKNKLWSRADPSIEGLEAVMKAPWYVCGKHRIKRTPPFSL